MERTTVRLAVVLFLMFLSGCTSYDAEISRLSRRVEVVAYYRWQNRSLHTTDLVPSYMEIRVDGKRKWRIEQGTEVVSNIYIAGDRLFVLILKMPSPSRMYLGVVCGNGHLAEFWDLTDLTIKRDVLIKRLSCEADSLGTFRVNIDYSEPFGGDDADSIVRRVTRHVKDLPCAPLIVENDGPPPPSSPVICKNVWKVGPWFPLFPTEIKPLNRTILNSSVSQGSTQPDDGDSGAAGE